MSTIIDLTMWQYWDDAMVDINTNFDSLNADKLEYSGTVPADWDLVVASWITWKVIKKKVFTPSQILESDSSWQPTSVAKGTAYNLDLGTTAGTVLEGNWLQGILPSGMIVVYAWFTAPTNYLLCDGAAVSRTTYATLFAAINPSLGTATMSIASPCVVSLTAHGLVLDDIIYFTTTWALPTGLAINTRYYVISAGLTANAFQISATTWGSAINTTWTQSWVHTLRRSPYWVGDGTTTFNTPNLKGSVVVGVDTSQTEFNAVGETGGEKTHTMTTGEMVAHTHQMFANGGWSTGGVNVFSGGGGGGVVNTASAGSTTPFNVLQPYISLNYIIKT